MTLLNTAHKYEPLAIDRNIHGLQVSTQILPACGALGGGDWCEAFAISDHEIGLSIGDISGHGINQYSTMVAIRQAIRSLACKGINPDHIMSEINDMLCRYDQEVYATGIYALFDTAKHSLVFANIGHPAPIIATPSKVELLEQVSPQLMLGIESDWVPVLQDVYVPNGSLLVLYTDGVTENDKKPLHGERDLLDAVSKAYTSHKSQFAEAIARLMYLETSNRDDAAVLALFSPLT